MRAGLHGGLDIYLDILPYVACAATLLHSWHTYKGEETVSEAVQTGIVGILFFPVTIPLTLGCVYASIVTGNTHSYGFTFRYSVETTEVIKKD